jgi:hypothetical protein
VPTKWQVQLIGQGFDLGEVATRLAQLDPTVVKDGDRYLLVGADFDRLDDVDDVRRAATEVVRLVNGLLLLATADFEPVSVGAITRLGPDGASRGIYAYEEAKMRAKARLAVAAEVITADGKEKPAPTKPPFEPVLEAARNDPRIRRVAEILSRGGLTWSDLSNVLEVIEEDVGRGISTSGWASNNELQRFGSTANSYLVLGPDARHAHERLQLPARPMSYEQARDLIFRVANAWVTSKLP